MELTLTPDTQTALLLCGELGQRGTNGLKPLGLRQYNALASWLKAQSLRPGDLLSPTGRTKLAGLQAPEVDPERVIPLLERGAALAMVVEKWERSGLWVISRSDSGYPERLKQYLGPAAPPLLYGIGTKDVLNRGGLVVVGSRDRSEEDGEFATRVGEHCAAEGIAVISGAAKGIDRDAMSGALDAGGWALGVLAEGLAKTATAGQFRAGLMNDRLTLVSPYDPDSRWFAYTAMDRNKLLYGLSDAALVVASSADTGGTWAGACEALQHGRVKVFVKASGTVAPGNPKLLRMGGMPFPEEPWDNLRALFTEPEQKNGQLFSGTTLVTHPLGESLATPLAEERTGDTNAAPNRDGASASRETPHATDGIVDAYTLAIEQIVALVNEPRTKEWLAERMSVRAAQMKGWLDRGVEEGRITKQKKPVRYVAHSPTLFTE